MKGINLSGETGEEDLDLVREAGYWDFATDFGVFDRATDAWREPLKAALFG